MAVENLSIIYAWDFSQVLNGQARVKLTKNFPNENQSGPRKWMGVAEVVNLGSRPVHPERDNFVLPSQFRSDSNVDHGYKVSSGRANEAFMESATGCNMDPLLGPFLFGVLTMLSTGR